LKLVTICDTSLEKEKKRHILFSFHSHVSVLGTFKRLKEEIVSWEHT